MFSLTQHIDARHNPKEQVLIFTPVYKYSRMLNGSLKNLANVANLVGALKTWEKVMATLTEWGMNFANDGPDATGETLPILQSKYGSNFMKFMIVGVYNNATGFYFRLGEETPPVGRGNIIIDSTNISVIFDDGTTATAAHGASYLNGDRFIIGCTLSYTGPLINAIRNVGQTVTEAFVGVGQSSKALTIADEFKAGANGNPVNIQCILAAQTDNDNGVTGIDAQAFFERATAGDLLLRDGFNN